MSLFPSPRLGTITTSSRTQRKNVNLQDFLSLFTLFGTFEPRAEICVTNNQGNGVGWKKCLQLLGIFYPLPGIFLWPELQWKKRTMIIENFPAYQACYIRLNLAPIKRARTKPATVLKLTGASLWESDFSL